MSQVTKRALEASLKNLLLQKPLDKITINDITADCGINRMTFYYHFKDIYDLVEWSCLEDAEKALNNKKTYDTWEQGLLQIFYAVQKNKPFIMNVYHCVSRERVEKYLMPLTDKLLVDVIEEQSEGLSVKQTDKDFIAQIYSYVLVGLMLDWVANDMKENPEKLVELPCHCYTGKPVRQPCTAYATTDLIKISDLIKLFTTRLHDKNIIMGSFLFIFLFL